jgi:predicted permease
MFEVTIKMAALIALGSAWRMARPGQLAVPLMRNAITDIVYYLFLPALVISVLWRTPLTFDSVRISVVALTGVFTGLCLSWLVYRVKKPATPVLGALLLASAFPNATYMGLPVLEAVFGPWARSIAIQYDLFACFPALITVGVMIAIHYGHHSGGKTLSPALLKSPPLVAAVAAVALNKLAVPQPQWLLGLLQMMAGAVVPLMLLSLGMSLRWRDLHWRSTPLIMPAIIIQLLIMPAVAWWLSGPIGLNGEPRIAVILEAAMPSMVLGIVFCERYGLDSSVYAAVVTLSTVISLGSLAVWLAVLN